MKKYTIMVIDYGQFTHIAEKLARMGHEVLYYVPEYDWCPLPDKGKIGTGLKGVTKIKSDWDFWKYVFVEEDKADKVDVFMFCWIGFSGLQEHLDELGYRTFGPQGSELLEIDRDLFNETVKKVGLPTVPVEEVTGVDALKEYLEKHPDTFVKISYHRGVIETFGAKYLDDVIDDICVTVGPAKNTMKFFIQEKIDSCFENGYDGFCVDGECPDNSLYGPEVKDAYYLGKIMKKMHAIVNHVLDKMKPELKKRGYSGSFHTEMRVTDEEYVEEFKGKPHFTDITCRPGSPPSGVLPEMYENYDEIIFKVASGELPDMKPAAEYGGELLLKSPWHKKHSLKVSFPKELEPWVKIKNHYVQDGEHWSAPMGEDDIFASVVAIGKSIEEVNNLIKERVKLIEAYQMEYDLTAIDEAVKVIECMKNMGCGFDL